MIALDLSDVPVESARRIPLASWFRFRRAVEHTPTALLVMEQQPIAGSCSSLVLKVSAVRAEPKNPAAYSLPHSKLLDQFDCGDEFGLIPAAVGAYSENGPDGAAINPRRVRLIARRR